MSYKKHQLSLVICVVIAAALACNFSASTAKIKNATLARDEKGEQLTTTFNPEDTFYLLGELSSAPADTRVKAIWTAVETTGNPANTLIGEKELESGSGSFTFSLENNSPLWPAGKYKVDLYLNDKLNQTLEFQVENKFAGEMQNLVLASDAEGKNATTVFTPQDDFYLLGELTGAPGEVKLKAAWTAVAIEGYEPNSPIDSAYLNMENGPFTFYLKKSQAGWPVGKYKVDLYMDEQLYQTLEFQVEGQGEVVETEPAVQQSSAAYENIRLSRDEQGTDATTVFHPSEPFYLVAELVGAPEAGAQVKVVWTAQKVEGSTQEGQVIDTYDKPMTDGAFWVGLTSDSGAWPVGEYKVEFYLDENLVETRDFIVSPIRLEDVSMAADQDGKNPTTVFGTQDVFYLVFNLVDAPDDTLISAKWQRLDEQGAVAEMLNEEDYTFGSGSYYIQLESNSGAWDPGLYQVDLYMNNNYYMTVPFEVQ
jgi:hypothetical protein